MLNTLVYNSPVYNGSQSVLFVRKLVYSHFLEFLIVMQIV